MKALRLFAFAGCLFAQTAAALLTVDLASVKPGAPATPTAIIAKRGEGEGQKSTDQMRRKLQILLTDRSQLRLHHETKPMAAYALAVAKPVDMLVVDHAERASEN